METPLHNMLNSGREVNLLSDYNSKVIPEIGSDAIWTVSSCKRGFGVKNLRDHDTQTYWQSDGNQPHKITCQFRFKPTTEKFSHFIIRKRQTVVGVLLYADYKCDESYTPSRITILTGNDFNDLRPIVEESISEPRGWIEIKIRNEMGAPLRTWMMQVSHQ